MLGLFATLNLGARSLATQQQGSEVAGQNLANVNNPAYSRQRLAISTSLPVPSMIGPQGSGVQSVAIVQLRDALLERQIQSETSVSGSLAAQQSALQNVQTQLGEQINTQNTDANSTVAGQYGLAQGLSDLFDGFQRLSTDPGSPSQRQVLLQGAQGLASQFNQVASRLDGVRTTLNNSIQSDVDQSNSLLTDIAKLNQQIVYSEAGRGGTANDLRDLRQQKIESLSKLVNVTTVSQPNGGLDVSIGGVTLLSGISQTDRLETYDAGGGQMLVRAQTAATPLTLTGGRIEGNINVRDGALATLQASTNQLAAQLITEVNAIHRGGYDLNGGTGLDLFSGTDAASIRVNAALVTDPSRLQMSGVPGAAGNNSVALTLAQLANKKVSTLNDQTFSQKYSATVAQLGQSLSSMNDQVENHSAVSRMLETQRNSISGVSLDEEMTDLVKYQKAFQASARLINVVSEMLETVVNLR